MVSEPTFDRNHRSTGVASRGGGRGAGERHRDHASGLPLEEQQFDSEQHGGNRRREGRRHAGRGASHEQGLPLRTGQVKELRNQRADGPASHDDRALGTERAAGTD
jgi:hypothetical protein